MRKGPPGTVEKILAKHYFSVWKTFAEVTN